MADYPATKEELLDLIAAARAELDAELAGYTDAEMVAGSEPLDWSVKDHLTHLGAWAVGVAALLNHQPRWEAMNLEPALARNGNFDEMNDALYHQLKSMTLAEARAYFDECHHKLVDAIKRLDYAELKRPYNDYQPHSNPESGKNPIIQWIAGDSYEHYPEHLPWIQTKIAKVRANKGKG